MRVNWKALLGVAVSSVVVGQLLIAFTGWSHWICAVLGGLAGLFWAPIFSRTER